MFTRDRTSGVQKELTQEGELLSLFRRNGTVTITLRGGRLVAERDIKYPASGDYEFKLDTSVRGPAGGINVYSRGPDIAEVREYSPHD